ncbi:hypothetical protein ASD52_23795 [Ensifer sp. Root142]|nr:hypothetical protein ASD52_23795 [Ensifer sp. Root142]
MLAFLFGSPSIRNAQEKGRVHGHKRLERAIARKRMPTVPRHLNRWAEKSVGRSRAQRDDDLGRDEIKFSAEPPRASLDLTGIRTRMKPTFAALLELEVFNSVGHITLRPIDASLNQALSKQLSRRSDEWASRKILLVARLLPDKHQACEPRSFAENELGRVPVKITALTDLRLCFQLA